MTKTVTRPPRAAAFLRVSTEEQGKGDRASLDSQRGRIEAYASREGMDVVQTFVENGVSGTLELLHRPEVLRLLAAAAAGEVDVVIFDRADRQARNAAEALNLERQLRTHGVAVHLQGQGERKRRGTGNRIKEGIDDLLAEDEVERILRRTADGRFGKAKKGLLPSSKPPFGYGNNKGVLYVFEDQAEIIRLAFARVVAGDSIKAATTALNGRFPTFTGTRGAIGFAHSTVGAWLRDPVYKGAGVVRWTAPPEAWDFRDHDCEIHTIVKGSLGKHCTVCRACRHENARPDEYGDIVCPTCARVRTVVPAPAIVSEEIWEDTQRLLDKTVREWHRTNAALSRTRPYPLTRRLFHLHDAGSRAGLSGFYRNHHRAYRCSHAVPKYKERAQGRLGYDPCVGWGTAPRSKLKLTSVRAAVVEAEAILRLVEAVQSPEAMSRLQAQADRQDMAAEAAKDLHSAAHEEREALDREREVILRQERRGALTEEEAEEALADLERRKVENGERISRLDHEERAIQAMRYTFDDLMNATVGAIDLSDITAADSEVITLNDGSEVEIGAWGAAIAYLRDDALAVLEDQKPDLELDSMHWLADMAARFDVRGVLVDGYDGEYQIQWTADPVLMFDRLRAPSAVNRARRGP